MKLIISLLLVHLSVHADPWGEFKDLFKDERPQIDAKLDKAMQMKADFVPLGIEISYEKCQEILAQIKRNYTSDPFFQQTVYGDLEGFGCGNNSISTAVKNYFSQRTLTSQNGMKSTYVLQTYGVSKLFKYEHFTSYSLDANYKLLEEIQYRYRDYSSNPRPWSIRILSVDATGNLYAHYFHTRFVYKHLLDMAKFVSADGMVPESFLLKSTWSTRPNTTQLTRSYFVAQPEIMKWENFMPYLPLAMSGGIFKAGKDLNVKPPAYRMYEVIHNNADYVCDWGYERVNKAERAYPTREEAQSCDSR